MLVHPVAFRLEQRDLLRCQVAVEAAFGRHDPPPGQVGYAAEDVGDGLAAAGTAQLLREVPEADELARPKLRHRIDHGLLERRRLVVFRPWGRVRVQRSRHIGDRTRRCPGRSPGTVLLV